MGWEAWFVLGVVGVVFLLLAFSRYAVDTILFGGLATLLVAGIVPVERAFLGFTSEGIITVGVLFVVAAGLRESGATWVVIHNMLGSTSSTLGAQMRLVFPVATMSAFWNNTPLVAVLLPAIQDWARKYQLPLSRLLIPLSFAAILGGLCTLIGTSTNLIANDLLKSTGAPGMGFFEIAWVGLPCAAVGLAYILLVGRTLLPDRALPLDTPDSPREYVLEMIVPPGSQLIQKTADETALTKANGIYLMEIIRQGRVLDEQEAGPLQAEDMLVFVGLIEQIVELQRAPGLLPAAAERLKMDDSALPHKRTLVEAVVSHTSPMVGRTISEGRFRTRYNSVVIAVARNGQRIEERLGDISLQTGDTLLLDALPAFVEQQRNSRDFYLVSRIEGYTPPRHERAWLAIGILICLVVAAATQILSLIQASMLAAGAMLVTHCISTHEARRSVDWRLLISVCSAYGIGIALADSGAAANIADVLVGFLHRVSNPAWEPIFALIIIHLITMLFTELLTNNAAVLLVFPIAQTVSESLGLDLKPFVATLMIAGSASFATPIGYQTNLMVYGPGGYRYNDFVKIGLPLNFIIAAVSLTLIPIIWPLQP